MEKLILHMRLVAMALVTLALFPVTSLKASDLRHCRDGWSNTQAGNYDRALALFQQCLSTGSLSAPDLLQTYRNIGITYRLAGAPEKAVENFDKALEIGPDHKDHVNRGNALSDMGLFPEAIASFENVDEQYQEAYREALYNLGMVAEKQGNFDEAKIYYKKALDGGLRSKRLVERASLNGVIDSVGEKDQLVYHGLEGFTFSSDFTGERFRGWRFTPKGQDEGNWNQRIIVAISSLAGRNDEERKAYATYFTNKILSDFVAPCAKSRKELFENGQRQFPSLTGIAICDAVDRSKLKTQDLVRDHRAIAIKYISTGQALYALEYIWQSDDEPADTPAMKDHFDKVVLPHMNLFGVYN